jgi:hypothetical protein
VSRTSVHGPRRAPPLAGGLSIARDPNRVGSRVSFDERWPCGADRRVASRGTYLKQTARTGLASGPRQRYDFSQAATGFRRARR